MHQLLLPKQPKALVKFVTNDELQLFSPAVMLTEHLSVTLHISGTSTASSLIPQSSGETKGNPKTNQFTPLQL